MSSKKSTAKKSTKATPAKAKPAAVESSEAKANAVGRAADKRIVGRFIQMAINNGGKTLDAIAKQCGVDVDRVQHHVDNFCNGKKLRVKIGKNGSVELLAGPIAMRKSADAIGEKYDRSVVVPPAIAKLTKAKPASKQTA